MNHRVCDILVKKTSGKTSSAQGKSVLFFAMGSDRSKRHPGLSGRSIFHFFATIHCLLLLLLFLLFLFLHLLHLLLLRPDEMGRNAASVGKNLFWKSRCCNLKKYMLQFEKVNVAGQTRRPWRCDLWHLRTRESLNAKCQQAQSSASSSASQCLVSLASQLKSRQDLRSSIRYDAPLETPPTYILAVQNSSIGEVRWATFKTHFFENFDNLEFFNFFYFFCCCWQCFRYFDNFCQLWTILKCWHFWLFRQFTILTIVKTILDSGDLRHLRHWFWQLGTWIQTICVTWQ